MEKRQRTRLASAGVVAVVFASGALVGMAVQRWIASEPTVAEVPQAPFDGPRQGGPGSRGRGAVRPRIYEQVLSPEQIVVADSLVRVSERRRDELERGFRRLTLEQRTVLVLRYLLDWPLDRIAEVLDVPVGTVGSRLNRALAALRAALEADARPAGSLAIAGRRP